MLNRFGNWLFAAQGLTPHGFCLLWQPGLIWLHGASDAAIGLSYFIISGALIHFVRRRRDLVFQPVFVLFAAFIMLCGAGHLVDLATLWLPVYVAQGGLKAATAFVSILTACVLWPLLPRALAMPSHAELAAAHAALRETEQELSDAKLRASDARFHMLAESTTDTIICLTDNMRPTYLSPACLGLLGTEPAGLLAADFAERVHRDDQANFIFCFRNVASGDTTNLRVIFRMWHAHGHVIWVEAELTRLAISASEMTGTIVLSARDITRRKQQEEELRATNRRLEQLTAHLSRSRDEAQRASRAKTRFLAGMSHELRTPLNGILGYAQLLSMEVRDNAQQSKCVACMLEAGRHLLEMINSVLDFSQIEAGRFDLQCAAVDPRAVAAACIDLVRPKADTRMLALSRSVAPDVPRHILADPTRLRQVLLNLLGNAVKFTMQGSVELRLRMADDSETLRIEVADTGPGIPPHRQSLLFRDFERLGADGTGLEGAGIGLALSAQLASRMGGRLFYEPNPAGGSLFCLELPVGAKLPEQDETAEISAALRPDELPVAEPAQRLRVMVVDDADMNRDIARRFLETAGHDVVCVEDGASAVQAAAEAQFDVVLMDVRMPGMDGLEATRRIRALGGRRAEVPVVAVTAQAFIEQVEDCRRAGMNGHLAKPFTLDSLLAKVASSVKSPAQWPEPEATMPTPAMAEGLQVLDQTAFAVTASLLQPDALATFLHTIAHRARDFLHAAHQPGAISERASELADMAHALAGSAGMFGFQRLADVAKRFERAAGCGSPEAALIIAEMSVAADDVLAEIRLRCGSTSRTEPTG